MKQAAQMRKHSAWHYENMQSMEGPRCVLKWQGILTHEKFWPVQDVSSGSVDRWKSRQIVI